MATMNKSYMSMYDTIDQAMITERQLESTLLKLKENEDLIKRMEAIEISQAEELSRLREENNKLENGLRSCDEKIEALVGYNTNLIDKVINFEAKAWAAQEYLKEVELGRNEDIKRAVEEAVVKFKYFEEFIALLKKEHDVGYDVGYHVGIEEISFNIWGKCRDFDYRFLGRELVKLMDWWLEEEKFGTLNTAPSPLLLDLVIEGNVIVVEVGLSEVPEQ